MTYVLNEAEQEVWLRLAEDAVPLPEPQASLAIKLKACRPNMATAANPESPWLFPGRSAGHPLQAKQLARRLGRIGVSRLGRLAGGTRERPCVISPSVLAGALPAGLGQALF